MALASCATGESYCDKALSDLAGKNQAVADSVKALMQSETWSAVAENVKQAYGGNQAALEATGGILASLILPGTQGCIPERLSGRPDEALGGGNQGPSAPAWARQHHRQRDPPFVPRKRLPYWASLELSPSVESCGCGLGPSPVRLG